MAERVGSRKVKTMLGKLQDIIRGQTQLESEVTDLAIILGKPKGWALRVTFGITLFSLISGVNRVQLARLLKIAAIEAGKV